MSIRLEKNLAENRLSFADGHRRRHWLANPHLVPVVGELFAAIQTDDIGSVTDGTGSLKSRIFAPGR